MFLSGTRVGIWLADHAAEAAVLHRQRKGWKVTATAEAALEGSLRDAEPQTLDALFADLRKRLPREVRRADTSVFLAIPDIYVTEEVLSFDAFPDTAGEAKPLVRQRCARELGCDPQDLAIAHEVVRGGTPTLVRVRIMDRSLRDRIEAAADNAGFRLNRLDGWLGYATTQGISDDAAFAVWADRDSWTLACGTENHPQGFSDAGEISAPTTIPDLARLMRSYAIREGLENPVLELCADGTFSESLAAEVASAGFTTREMHLPDAPATRAGQVAAWA